MDPKVWSKLLTLHRRGYGWCRSPPWWMPPPAELRNRPQDWISWIQKVAAVEWGFWLLFWSFGGTCVYIGGRSTSVEHRGTHEAGGRPVGGGRPLPSWLPPVLLGVGSKSPGSYPRRKSRSKKDFSVWTPFDILFLRNTEIGKKQQFWAGPPVNRLVPKII